MSPEEYAELRKALGTQEEVAKRLDVHVQTLSRRERGKLEIDTEARLAMLYLARLAALR